MEKLNLDLEALKSMHRFGDILEDAISGIHSDIAEFTAIRDARDCIGRHWYGMRCGVTCKRSGLRLYLHIGLIYYPTTRHGLMVELDEQNNKSVYHCVLQNIKERPEFEINRDEPVYFKLFMPDAVFADMSGRKRGEQLVVLRRFVQAAGEAMIEAAYEEGFRLDYKNMADALNLANAFDKALNEVKGDVSKADVNYSDKDNFGQYSIGFRYYLSDKEDTYKLYAYFGAIFSYKKQPAGIFAEIDWFSNRKDYDAVFENMEMSPMYDLSVREPKFIKLFMKEEMVDEFNRSDYDAQISILLRFLKECNDQIIKARIKGGAKNDR